MGEALNERGHKQTRSIPASVLDTCPPIPRSSSGPFRPISAPHPQNPSPVRLPVRVLTIKSITSVHSALRPCAGCTVASRTAVVSISMLWRATPCRRGGNAGGDVTWEGKHGCTHADVETD